MPERSGPFWDAVEGRSPLPPAAASLGLEVIEDDPDNGTIELAFEAVHDFTTPRGDVLEGYLAAMLHDTVGPAVLATLEPGQFIITLDLNANFLRSAYPGRLVGRGSVVRRDADIAYAEAASTTRPARSSPPAPRRFVSSTSRKSADGD